MVCTCEHCFYTFETLSQPEQCPDCGKYTVRAATMGEILDYRRIRVELDRELLTPWYRLPVEQPRMVYSR